MKARRKDEKDSPKKLIGKTSGLDNHESTHPIARKCDEIKSLLMTKNRKYGNSALDPVRIFSTSDKYEQIRVRLDDKLSRIVSAQNDENEDVLVDLVGYLILYLVAMEAHDE